MLFILHAAASAGEAKAVPVDFAVEWKAASEPAFFVPVPDGKEVAVVVWSSSAQRPALPSVLVAPKPEKKAGPHMPLDRACFYTIDPAGIQKKVKGFAPGKLPRTEIITKSQFVLHTWDGVPTAEEMARALATVPQLTDVLRARVLERLKVLEAALAIAKSEAAAKEDLVALIAAAKQADADQVAGAERYAQRLAEEEAAWAASNANRLLLAGNRDAALTACEAALKAFAGFPEAEARLAAARDGIVGDKPGMVLGAWWHGGALGGGYYTGPGAREAGWFEAQAKAMAKEVGLPYREFSPEDVMGTPEDENGVAIYPDGAARVRVMLMPGGSGNQQREGMGGDKGAANLRSAFRTGMGWVGICGGCYFVSPYAGGLWPGEQGRQSVKQTGAPHDFVLLPFHPLARLAKMAVLKEPGFTGGATDLMPWPDGTEGVGFFRNGQYEGMSGKMSVMAYRAPDLSGGRLVVTPGHPELKYGGFLLNMAQYALRHPYPLPRHPLEIGKSVTGVCGDRQNQFYEVRLADGVKKVTATLTGVDGPIDLALHLGVPKAVPVPRFAVEAPPQARKPVKDVSKSLVVAKGGTCFVLLHGAHDIRNGACYTLTITTE